MKYEYLKGKRFIWSEEKPGYEKCEYLKCKLEPLLNWTAIWVAFLLPISTLGS